MFRAKTSDCAIQLLLVWHVSLLLIIQFGVCIFVELQVSVASGTAAKATVELE